MYRVKNNSTKTVQAGYIIWQMKRKKENKPPTNCDDL